MNRTCAAIDRLEPRMLLASITLSTTGLLSVTVSPSQSLVVSVRTKGASYAVDVAGMRLRTFPRESVKALFIRGGHDDAIFVRKGVDVPTTIRGGLGMDDLVAGYKHTLIETDLNDNITPVAGNVIQYMWLGPGIEPARLSFMLFVGGFGDPDNLFYAWITRVNDPSGEELVDGEIIMAPHLTFRLTNNPDSLYCDTFAFPTAFDLGGGDDTVSVVGAHTTVIGGAGNDLIRPDPLMVASSNVYIGGSGNDTLIGGPGDDTLYGGDGNDSLRGGGGDDLMWGGAGDDTLRAGGGRNSLFGQAGNDLLAADNGQKDFLDGGTGTDQATRDHGPSVFDSVKNIESFIP